MNILLGLIGITLIGIGVGTLLVDWVTGVCAGIILLGLGLLIDAVKK